MKKFIAGLLIGCIISFGIAYAEDIINVQKASFAVWINGKQFETDKPIITVDNTAYVPVKDFTDYIDAKTTWNSESKRVEILQVPYFSENSVLTDKIEIQIVPGNRSCKSLEANKDLVRFGLKFKNVDSTPISIDFSKDFKLRDSQYKIVNCISNETLTIEPGQTKFIEVSFEVEIKDISDYLNFIYKPSIREYSIPVCFEADSVP
ncbi:stalk domain-containing protein [Acetivibrio cellulolyticus]|uniref:stalk domain-containing protein n=1 Tax=Acetivibrio cellulolyticus TaxID=35830 RepID=UPI0001E2FB7D|nr:stalk domain-containing protein [Acetivibrio cellulolyticus]